MYLVYLSDFNCVIEILEISGLKGKFFECIVDEVCIWDGIEWVCLVGG